MAKPTTATVSMKLLIDTKEKRVLFAEAGKDCVDFLFHILSLPVATVIGLLEAEGMEGSWPNLYKSLENLNVTYIQQGKNKDTLLKPAAPLSSTTTTVPLLPHGDASPVGKNFYTCSHCCDCSGCECYGGGGCDTGDGRGYVSDDWRAICPAHKVQMTLRLAYVAPPAMSVAADGGGLVKGVVTYMVMDDLEVKPMSTISSIALLNSFKVKDVSALVEKDVKLGMHEALKMLKASHRSTTVLSDVFC